MHLSVVIVNWNTRDLLLRCLESLCANAPPAGWELFVVDNASSDGSVDMVRERFPHVTLIANERNLGFAAANNQAIKRSTGRYLLLLNSDTEVLPGALQSMLEYLDANPHAGAAGCRLLNADGTTQRSCWRGYPGLLTAVIDGLYLWKLTPRLVAGWEVALDRHMQPQAVDHLLGACIMVRREVIDAVGGLDEGYYLFFEETDWCRRIQLAGWKIVYLPQPQIIHLGQQSMRQVPARTLPTFYTSLCRFVRRSGGPRAGLRLATLKTIIMLSTVLRLGLWSARLIRQPELSKRMLGGYLQVLRQLPAA